MNAGEFIADAVAARSDVLAAALFAAGHEVRTSADRATDGVTALRECLWTIVMEAVPHVGADDLKWMRRPGDKPSTTAIMYDMGRRAMGEMCGRADQPAERWSAMVPIIMGHPYDRAEIGLRLRARVASLAAAETTSRA